MNLDIVESILQKLDRRMNQEKRKVILFWDNATCHPESKQAGLKNIKLVFLPKNTTSRLQPLDAGIIRNFKHKYRKLLVRDVVSRIDEEKTASEIIEEVHVLKAITWLQIPADLVAFTEEILSGKLHFLCSDGGGEFVKRVKLFFVIINGISSQQHNFAIFLHKNL